MSITAYQHLAKMNVVGTRRQYAGRYLKPNARPRYHVVDLFSALKFFCIMNSGDDDRWDQIVLAST